MQVAEEEIQARCRSDEEFINFRPSPNFKHKKYLRSKFEEAMMIEANSSIVEPNASLGHNQLEKVNNTLGATAKAQPPLPPNPPPPDSPPMIINLKQEIEDDDYKGSTSTEISSDFSQSEEIKATAAVIKTDNSEEKPGVTMCRNFARGTCKKGAACIFAHELILSQLPGVYTFCRNFQNSVCSFPKCKFVHATVFEKEHFFRTGYLPPHTLAHLKETTVVQQPPPPSRTEESSAEHSAVYCNAPPGPAISCISSMSVRYNAEAGIERTTPEIFRVLSDSSTSPQKRDWSEVDEVSSPACDRDSGELQAKKCKTCPSNALSERLLKAKVDKMTRRNKERKLKIAQLNKKNGVLTAMLGVFLKSSNSRYAEHLLLTDKDNFNNSNVSSFLANMFRNQPSDGA